MARLEMIPRDQAPDEVKRMYDAVQSIIGMVPNVFKVMANSPAVLRGFMGFSSALGQGKLPAQLRERISIAVAYSSKCHYCLSAHTAAAIQLGIVEDEIAAARRFESRDAKFDAGLKFVSKTLGCNGHVDDSDVEALRAAGYEDGHIAELVANVAINLFTNCMNMAAQTDIDFPLAKDLP